MADMLGEAAVFLLRSGALLLAMLLGAGLGVRLYLRRQIVREIAAWERAFPGRCMVCAYHRYGVMHGFVPPGERVAPHDCTEASDASGD